MNEKRVSILAAGVAFYGMLSIFPALAALIAIYGLLANPANVQEQINRIHTVIPGEAHKLIAAYLTTIASAKSSKLSISLLIGLVIAIWSARAGVVSLMQALNAIYDEKEKRGLIRFQLAAIVMTFAGVIFAIVALILIAAIPAALHLIATNETLKLIGTLIPWPLLILMISVGLAVVYRFAPSRPEAKWRWLTWGSVVATLLWVAASAGFSFYVAKFGHYDKTFGSLGAVVILLTWLYLSAYATLLGASLNVEIDRASSQGSEKEVDHGPS